MLKDTERSDDRKALVRIGRVVVICLFGYLAWLGTMREFRWVYFSTPYLMRVDRSEGQVERYDPAEHEWVPVRGWDAWQRARQLVDGR